MFVNVAEFSLNKVGKNFKKTKEEIGTQLTTCYKIVNLTSVDIYVIGLRHIDKGLGNKRHSENKKLIGDILSERKSIHYS